MKKNITFRMWVSVFFGGIWQFFRNIFSWKNKTPFWRVIWGIITICVLFITCAVGYVIYDEFYGSHKRFIEENGVLPLSDNYRYYPMGNGKSYIKDMDTDDKIMTGLDWISRSSDGDSLVVVAKNGKRAFFNRYTGALQIPFNYDAAWCFNDGVAGVCIGDSVFFIDHSGKPINNHKYPRMKGKSYSYHGEYASIGVDGLLALIDRGGYIITTDLYEELIPMANNMWASKRNGKMGVINDKGFVVVPNEYAAVEIYPEGGIVVMSDDNSKKRFDYDGKETDEFVYDYTYTLEYYSDELDNEGNRIKKPANLWYYSCNDHCGLIDKSGKPLTPPIYQSIEAFSADLFECQIDSYGERIILNSKGQKVN